MFIRIRMKPGSCQDTHWLNLEKAANYMLATALLRMYGGRKPRCLFRTYSVLLAATASGNGFNLRLLSISCWHIVGKRGVAASPASCSKRAFALSGTPVAVLAMSCQGDSAVASHHVN